MGAAGRITMTKQHPDGGFTLVEVLLVIMIIGLLATVVMFSVGGITAEAQESTCAADARALSVATQSYFAQWAVDSIVPSGLGAERYERTLVDRGFLHGPSQFYDLDVAGELVQVTGSPCIA